MLENGKARIVSFVRYLCDLDIQPPQDGRASVFFGRKTRDQFISDTDVCLCYVHDILENDTPQTYDYMLVAFSEVIGYSIADTPYTLSHIPEVLADILYEISFTGFSQREKDEEKTKLDDAIRECDEKKATARPIEELWAEIGRTPEPMDEREDELRCKIVQAEQELEQYYLAEAVKAVRETLGDTKE